MAQYFEIVSIVERLSGTHYHVWDLLYLLSGENACEALSGVFKYTVCVVNCSPPASE